MLICDWLYYILDFLTSIKTSSTTTITTAIILVIIIIIIHPLSRGSQNGSRRSGQHKIHQQQTKIQRPATTTLVLSSMRAPNARRERLQMPHPIRISRPPNAPRRRRSQEIHKSILPGVPIRFHQVATYGAWRETGAHQPFLPGVHRE